MTHKSKGAARAVADLSRGLILASVEIQASPERVFEAISTAELTQWWGSADTYRVRQFEADLRPGGAWRSDGVGRDGKPFSVSGEILEIDPPRLLVQTWSYDWGSGPPTTIRYQIDPIPGGSRVTVWHEGFGAQAQACEDHALGWERVLSWLGAHFPPPPSAETRTSAEGRAEDRRDSRDPRAL
jgi:uncharacterized protein YndB with AHSA1/START domain